MNPSWPSSANLSSSRRFFQTIRQARALPADYGRPVLGRRRGTVDDLLDDIDRQLLALLHLDARRSVNELAQQVGVGRATAYQRLARLRERGVIKGFTVRVDPARLGLHLSALILIRVEQHAWRELTPQLLALPGAEWLGAAAGEFDFVLLVRVADVATLRDVVLEGLQAMPEIRSSETVLLLEDHRVAG